jgi:phosphinothricin acetyltransferase
MTKPNVTLRLGSVADADAINEIYNHYVLNATSTYQTEPSTREERLAWFEAHGPLHPVTIAEIDGQIVGWGSLSKFHPRAAYERSVEDSVYLRNDCRGKGIGSVVLADLIERALALGHHTVLGGIDFEQKASIALHKKLGFEPVAHYKEVGYKFGRWLDVVWMQKML